MPKRFATKIRTIRLSFILSSGSSAVLTLKKAGMFSPKLLQGSCLARVMSRLDRQYQAPCFSEEKSKVEGMGKGNPSAENI